MHRPLENTISYGIRRLILINSGMYKFGFFPIDCPLSISGQNNSGKSTAINALQFIFLADMRDMDFGKHDELETKKFYFSSPGSYVLAEIHLPHGDFVVGATGAGAAAQYRIQHFAYAGRFNPADYHENGTTLELNELLRGLQGRGAQCVKLRPQELRNMLLGVPGEHAFDITLFPLRGHRERYIKSLVSVFKNLLHMRNVNSQDLKRLFLDIFDIHLVSSDIDFAAAYRKATSEVQKIEDELEVLKRMRKHVNQIVEKQERRQELRGRLHGGYPRIQRRLEAWYEDYRTEQQKDREQLETIEPKRQELHETVTRVQTERETSSGERAKLQDWLESFEKQRQEFQLVQSPEVLDDQIAGLDRQFEETMKKMGVGESAAPEKVENQITETKTQIAKLEQKIENWSQNLWTLLADTFSPEQLAQVFALFNAGLLELPVNVDDGVTVHSRERLEKTIRACLEKIEDGVYRGDEVTVPLAPLLTVDPSEYLDPAVLEKRKTELQENLRQLEGTLKAAREMEALKKKRESLRKTIEEKTAYRNAYRDFQERCPLVEGKEQRLKEVEEKLAACRERQQRLREDERRLDQNAQSLKESIANRDKQRARLMELQGKVKKLSPEEPAGDLAAQHEEWPESLQEALEMYALDWDDKEKADTEIRQQIGFIEEIGGGTFLRDNEEDCIKSLVESNESIPQREDLLEKAKTNSIAQLGSSLKGLRDNYHRLKIEITKFNKAINKRAISNLTKLEIRLQPNEDVLGSVEEVVNMGVNRLLGDARKAENAAGFLYRWVSGQGRQLNLTHLFELCFVVFSQDGHEVVYQNLDQIESHGTTITIKALVNMHMMGHLLDDSRRGEIHFPYYLDEAAAIDPANQETLIEQGFAMGFVPILASVKAQTCATYCVRIDTPRKGRKIVIDEVQWVELHRKMPDEEHNGERVDSQTAETVA
ncbi:MAG: hypothetical protein K9N51_10640 [Candidatus Pacebacteria bacterium]|nr:hypothetical protein [Candidatus Paceibacterota bacterium]